MILDTAYLYNMTERRPKSLREASAKAEELTDLEMELEALQLDYDEFGAEGFYGVKFERFEKEFPVFTKKCVVTFLKEMEILTAAELKDKELVNKYWQSGELIIPSDWPCLFKGAKQLIRNGAMQWEKVYSAFAKANQEVSNAEA